MQQLQGALPPALVAAFQSPIHRGDRCNFKDARVFLDRASAFSPLFIGVIGATERGVVTKDEASEPFSPLFIGVIGATYMAELDKVRSFNFQSPIHRGDRCNAKSAAARSGGAPTFSPLFIGVIGATDPDIKDSPLAFIFQSPIHRGDRCNS